MTDTMQNAVLRRMMRRDQDVPSENPLTTSRAVRLALTKAANDAVGLVLTVSSVSEYANALDAMLADLPAGLMLVALHRDDALAGFIAVDPELRAAVLEMETMSALSSQATDDRAPTSADLAMCKPLITSFLAAFPDAVLGTDLAGWCDHVSHHERIADVRAAGLILEDVPYRVLQMDVQLTGTDRQGALLLALPPIKAQETIEHDLPSIPPELDWKTHFPSLVAEAPATLTALLHKFHLPLEDARGLQVGSVLPLRGCSVSSVRLLAPDGQEVSQAKLGQSGGMRAVRIEAAPMPDLHALDTSGVDHSLSAEPAPDLLMPADEGMSAMDTDIAIDAPLGFDAGMMLSDEDLMAQPEGPHAV